MSKPTPTQALQDGLYMQSSTHQMTTKIPKPKRFFYHYNKPASHAQGRNVITIHWEGKCHLVNKIKTIGLDVESHNQKHQPRCIMRGFANKVEFRMFKVGDDELTGIIS
jgi:hypothetical protein